MKRKLSDDPPPPEVMREIRKAMDIEMRQYVGDVVKEIKSRTKRNTTATRKKRKTTATERKKR